MSWLLLLLLPVTFFAGLDLLCRGEVPAVLRRAAAAVVRVLRGIARSGSRRGPVASVVGRRRPPPSVDVFDTLRVQSRLSAVADEIVRLESDSSVFARAARLRASRRAYDDLLTEACRLAGVGLDTVGLVDAGLVDAGAVPGAHAADDLEVRVRNSDAARANAEFELAARGWSW